MGKLILVLMCVAGVAAVPYVYGISFKDISRTLTQEPRHFQNSPERQTTSADDNYRGRAQELRPDISVPPPAGSET